MIEDVARQQEHIRCPLPCGVQYLTQRVKVVTAVIQAEMQVRAMDEYQIGR